MSAFNLDAAKRGEKVQYDYGVIGGGLQDVHFIGVVTTGKIVVESFSGAIVCALPANLRMAPKPPKEMWVQLYQEMGFIGCTNAFDTPDMAMRAAEGFKLIDEPQKVLVPEDV